MGFYKLLKHIKIVIKVFIINWWNYKCVKNHKPGLKKIKHSLHIYIYSFTLNLQKIESE